MPLIDFKDAVTGANLDPKQTHAVFYMDGAFANEAAVAAQCPHAKLFAITVFGATGPRVFALDCETHNLGAKSDAELIDKADAWVAEQIRLGVKLIVVYANLNLWETGLLERLAKYGHRIKRWDAHYDGVRAIPPWADAEQYADPGPVDLNVALATFFGDTDPQYGRFDNTPRLVFKKRRRERGQVELYDRLRALQTRTKHPRRAQLTFVRCVLRFYAGRVWAVAHIKRVNGKPSWDVYSRGWRYQELVKRAQGQRLV